MRITLQSKEWDVELECRAEWDVEQVYNEEHWDRLQSKVCINCISDQEINSLSGNKLQIRK